MVEVADDGGLQVAATVERIHADIAVEHLVVAVDISIDMAVLNVGSGFDTAEVEVAVLQLFDVGISLQPRLGRCGVNPLAFGFDGSREGCQSHAGQEVLQWESPCRDIGIVLHPLRIEIDVCIERTTAMADEHVSGIAVGREGECAVEVDALWDSNGLGEFGVERCGDKTDVVGAPFQSEVGTELRRIV